MNTEEPKAGEIEAVTNSNLPGVRRLVILGHSGFVGARLFQYFTQRYRDLEVTGLSSHELDLERAANATRLARYMDKDTVVVMCSGIKSNFGSNLENYGRNIAMAQTLSMALQDAPMPRVIFFSSIAVYGVDKHDINITEATPIIGDTYYGLSKSHSEGLLQLACHRCPAELTILRTPTIYGPDEKIIAATPSGFLTTVLKGDQVSVWGDGSELREFLYIDDLLRIVDTLLRSKSAGVLNVASGQGRSYQESLDIISGLLNREVSVHRRERTKTKVDKVYDISRLRQLIPDVRFTSLEKGLQQIAEARN